MCETETHRQTETEIEREVVLNLFLVNFLKEGLNQLVELILLSSGDILFI